MQKNEKRLTLNVLTVELTLQADLNQITQLLQKLKLQVKNLKQKLQVKNVNPNLRAKKLKFHKSL